MPQALSIRSANRLEQYRRQLGNPFFARTLAAVCHFFLVVYIQFDKDRCYQMASALTYTALLAIVPITAVTFALFNTFDAFSRMRSDIQAFLIKQLVPSSDLAQKLDEYVTQFTANTYQVTFVSVISLFVTAVALFMTIEYSLGHIWSEKKTRSFLGNLSTFTSILVWGPLLLGLSTYLTVTVNTAASTYVDPITGSRLWHYLFPYATSVLMFFLGFTILPSARVEYRAALLGAGTAALLWELAKYGFAYYIQNAVFYTNVYGSLSTVPVFLLWVYVSWVIFLFGAEICYCYQYRSWLRLRGAGAPRNYALKLVTGLGSLMVITRRFRDGSPPPTVKDIAGALAVPNDVVESALRPLRSAGILMSVRGKSEVHLLARSPRKITALQVVEAMFPPALPGLAVGRPELEHASEVLKELEQAQADALGEKSLWSLVERFHAVDAMAGAAGAVLGDGVDPESKPSRPASVSA